MNQRSKGVHGRMEKMRTNLAWPTLGDSDVPPAEERANHIHTCSLMVVRERTVIAGTAPWSPRAPIRRSTTRANAAITLTGHRESTGRDAIARNDDWQGETDHDCGLAKSPSFSPLTAFVSDIYVTGFEERQMLASLKPAH